MPDNLIIRQARPDDIAAIVALFADDKLGGHGDTADPAALPDYQRAFAWIEASANDTLYVAELDGVIVGTFQTTITISMTGRGRPILTIEAVQTAQALRGRGIGAQMVNHGIAQARAINARLVQLMSNKLRTDAHRFYVRLGFKQSHEGFKLKL